MEILFEKTALKNSLTSNSPSILHENKTEGEEGQHRFLFSDLTLIFFHASDLRVIPTKCKPGSG